MPADARPALYQSRDVKTTVFRDQMIDFIEASVVFLVLTNERPERCGDSLRCPASEPLG
jgi:hypothetical protein